MINKTKFVVFVSSLFAAVGAQAAVITWDGPVTVTLADETDVSTEGTFEYAYNFGGATTVNGVTFAAVAHNTDAATGLTNLVFSGGDSTFKTQIRTDNLPGGAADPSTAYGDLLRSNQYNANPETTFTLQNLSIGTEYLVQLWSSDDRYNASQNQNIVSGVSLSTQDGQYVLGSFTATEATQAIVIDASSSSGILNALQVRAVPEPSSFALLAGCLALGAVMNRRRRA